MTGIPYINPAARAHRTERQVAIAIAYPISLVLIIAFYLLKLLTKILYKAKRWLWRLSLFTLMFLLAASNLTLSVSSPKAQAALDHLVIVTPTPAAPTQTDIVLAKPHGDILFRIWTLESSRGQHGRDECTARGMVNDFGFDVANHQCFGSFDAELDAVSAWFDTTLKTHPLANTLCIYNEGIDEAGCTYARDFMGI